MERVGHFQTSFEYNVRVTIAFWRRSDRHRRQTSGKPWAFDDQVPELRYTDPPPRITFEDAPQD